jgi:hypothetical protein
MRKLIGLIALVSVLGLTAASAPAAFAGVASESLPNTEAKNWTGVKAECNGAEIPLAGCEFVATSTAWALTNLESPFTTCEMALKGKVFKEGRAEITSAEFKTQTTLCKRFRLNTESPWTNQICEYTGSSPHSYYDRLSFNFFEAAGEKIKGPIFIHLLNASKLDASPLTVAFGSVQKFGLPLKPAEVGVGPWGWLADGESGSTMYAFGAKPVIKVTSTETKCEWPFGEKLNELP